MPDRHLAVLVANGNAGNRSGRAPLARALSERGLAVLLFDYRGYGGNPGSPSEPGLARNVPAAMLADRSPADPTDRLWDEMQDTPRFLATVVPDPRHAVLELLRDRMSNMREVIRWRGGRAG